MTFHRETLTQYITFNRKGEGSLHSCTWQSCNCDVLHRRLGADSDKIPEGGTFSYILHLSVLHAKQWCTKTRNCSDVKAALSPWSDLHLVHNNENDGEVEDLQRGVGQLEGAQVVVQTAQLILPTASAQLSSFSQRDRYRPQKSIYF